MDLHSSSQDQSIVGMGKAETTKGDEQNGDYSRRTGEILVRAGVATNITYISHLLGQEASDMKMKLAQDKKM